MPRNLLTVDEEVALTAIWERTPVDPRVARSLREKGLVTSVVGAGLLDRITEAGKATLRGIDEARDAEASGARPRGRRQKARRFSKGRILAPITSAQWDQLGAVLAKGPATEAACRTATGLPTSVVMALFIALATDGAAKNHWLVYHACREDRVATRPLDKGFQPCPWRCPGCLAAVEKDALTYELQCTVNGPITFEA